MANVYGHLHWALDTKGVITTDKLRVQKINYIPDASSVASHVLTIKDNNAETIWTATPFAAGQEGELSLNFGDQGHDFLGMNITQMGTASSDAGTLYVYFK